MGPIDILRDVSTNFKVLTSKPEQFLSVQDEKAENSKKVLKKLYDLLKQEEIDQWQPTDALPDLITAGFDEEQIWQEVELQNEGLANRIVKDVAVLLSKKDGLAFEEGSKDEVEDDSEERSSQEEEDEDQEDEELEEEDFSDEERGGDSQQKLQFISEVDDDFFKLCEMENFCEAVEKEEGGKGKGAPFDLFGDVGDGSDEERELVRYNDFFMPSKRPTHKQSESQRKSVRFAEEEFSEDEDKAGEEPSGSDAEERLEEGEDEGMEREGPKSGFEARQDRIQARIRALEDAALQPKPWHLQGEVTSAGRPQNSLLEEFVEFDRAARPAPVFTEKTTLRLEDIIKQRVKDKSWDDVARKVKPVEDIREYRKKLVLDQEKSKLSLAEIYEQEYVKQRDATAAAASGAEPREEAELAEHVQIKNMIKTLFTKLDALSNFHYTPKPVAPEIKIISNLPAISMEDVAPVAMSDAALLAPEEIKAKQKGELMSKEERTTTDKLRQRRQKKLKQRAREKEKQKKEKLMSKMPLGLGNKYSKEKAKKTLEKLSKESNVDKMVETQSKAVKSSSAFFSKLEDQVRSQVKRKTNDGGKKKKLLEKISAKKIKF